MPVRSHNSASDLGAAAVGAYAHGRVPRRIRVQHVLALAADLFAERGYVAASMDELARRAGVSKPVVYDLVGSKDALFSQCIDRAADELAAAVSAAVAAEGDPGARFGAGGLAFFRFVEGHRSVWRVLLSAAATPFAGEVDAVRRRQAHLVGSLIAAGAEDVGGRVAELAADPLRVEALAHAINGAFESLATWWQGHPELSAQHMADLLDGLVRPGLQAMSE